MEEYIIEVNDLTVRFNLASQRVDNVKEYFIKLMRHELMFQEFLPLKHISFNVRAVKHGLLLETMGVENRLF